MITVSKRRSLMNRVPVCFELYRLQELDFDGEEELQDAARNMVDEVYALTVRYNSLLDRVNASRSTTLSRQRSAAVERVKAIESRMHAHIRAKVHVTSGYDEAAKRHSIARERLRSLRDNAIESRMTDSEIGQRDKTVRATQQELEAAGAAVGKAKLAYDAWISGEATIKRELALAEEEVNAITRERRSLGAGAGELDGEPDRANGLGSAVAV